MKAIAKYAKKEKERKNKKEREKHFTHLDFSTAVTHLIDVYSTDNSDSHDRTCPLLHLVRPRNPDKQASPCACRHTHSTIERDKERETE